jgi:hypothetical protein
MKLNIKVTNSTIILATVTVILAVINNLYLNITFYDLIGSSPEQIKEWVKSYWLYKIIPLVLGLSILPIFWVWQNYKAYPKKWLYLIALLTILLNLQVLVAVAVFAVYLYLFWQEFLEERKKNA